MIMYNEFMMVYTKDQEINEWLVQIRQGMDTMA